jgi:ECF transporter S component (folate family)
MRGIIMGKSKIIHRITLDAMLAALYVVLAYITLPIGNIRLTIASLPVALACLALGIGDGVSVAFLGEFINQLLKYGFTLTTPIWLVPPIIRALVIGLFAHFYRKQGQRLEDHYVIYFVAFIVAAVITTGANTLALYLDALVFDYPFAFVLYETIIRFFTGILTAVLLAIVAQPLSKIIRNYTFNPI